MLRCGRCGASLRASGPALPFVSFLIQRPRLYICRGCGRRYPDQRHAEEATARWNAQRQASEAFRRQQLKAIKRTADLCLVTPAAFEVFAEELFRRMGYHVTRVGGAGDGGVDLRLTRWGRPAIVQCKRYKHHLGEAVIRDFWGTMQHEGAKYGYVLTTGAFSRAARTWAAGKPIRLLDGPALLALRRDHHL